VGAAKGDQSVSAAEIVAYATAAVSVLGGTGVLVNDRRKGRHDVTGTHLSYIEAQQQDITDLRTDLSLLWDWAVRSIRKASEGGVVLDPLPTRPPSTEKG
jgi:hypothetical protein